MALEKRIPQNELGDITSEPCVELNSFRVINQFVSSLLFQWLYRNGGSKFISIWPLRREFHRMSWEISFQNLV